MVVFPAGNLHLFLLLPFLYIAFRSRSNPGQPNTESEVRVVQTDLLTPPESIAPDSIPSESIAVDIYDQIYRLRGIDPAYVMRHTGELEPHFNCGQRTDDGGIVRVAQVPEAKRLP